MSNIDLNKYSDFVEAVTSQASNDFTTFISRLDWIDGDLDNEKFDPKINVSLLLTAALGMAAETGEFCEILQAVTPRSGVCNAFISIGEDTGQAADIGQGDLVSQLFGS